MQYELVIAKGKDETIINYLKKFDFVTIRKKERVKKKTNTASSISYFDALPDWDFNPDQLRKNQFRKTKTTW
jgi:hypothetical protein